MKIVWDEPKRLANLDKHGSDFADVEEGFDFATALVFPASPSATGARAAPAPGPANGEMIVVMVVSPLGTEGLSVVNLRRASPKERTLYD